MTECTEKTVSSNRRHISLIYSQWKNFFPLKKVLLIQKKIFWSKEKICLHLRKFCWF